MKLSTILNAILITQATAALIGSNVIKNNARFPSAPIEIANLKNAKTSDEDSHSSNNTDSSDSSESSNEESKSEQEEQEEQASVPIPIQCSRGDYEIKNVAELEKLYECDDIIGSIHITNFLGPTIDTGSIKSISGDLTVTNAANLVRINVPNLAVIGGSFSLRELTSLTAVHAPHLNHVGSIDWKVLPILSTVSFETGIKKITSITISDTSLIGFSGFDVDVLKVLNLNNNRFLDSINSNVKGIQEKLAISANAKGVTVNFPELEYANNITIRDVSSLNLSRVEKVNASMELISNQFQSLKLPKLRNVGGTLSLIGNANLKDVEFNNIDEVGGGLMVVNNSNIDNINFFPKLTSIGGAIELIGQMKEASFSKLRLVKGSAKISSVYDSFDCSKWTRGNEETGSIVRGGKISCINGKKKHDLDYNENGEILDESITIIEDENKNSNKLKAGGSTSDAPAQFFLSTTVLVGMIVASALQLLFF
ncbi:hypothetical protein WICPIJ_006883 [Wickerhamomyces pijperi]|uniref:Receptor L-domain domain-containing protein n=1 Tax=Wickerhamomyces pijperi TaxID=599730 RepID=A0A9P8Q3E7_WICPI|nr:hypothetical protein WICPIJ_006883 [Wickerhamomyces pijperi]